MPWRYSFPEATIQRLSTYLTILRTLQDTGQMTASSSEIAGYAGLNPAQVRKDLSYFGDFGRRGLGYRVKDLINHLTRILGIEHERRVIVVGAGNLGAALVGYPGFGRRGFRIVGLYDSSPAKVGRRIGGMEIFSTDRIAEDIKISGAELAIIAVPDFAAQDVVNLVQDAGIHHILNLAPVQVTAPEDTIIRHVDMTSQLELLSFCLACSGSDQAPDRGDPDVS